MAVTVSKKKKVEALVKIQVKAGEANPAPPIGTALGPRGVNIMEFCKAFNAQTQNLPGIKKGTPLPVVISIYGDRSFTFEIKTPPASVLLKEVMGLTKGSSTPHSHKIGKITRAQLVDVAQKKRPDLSAADLDAAVRTIAGSAKSMGLEVEE